ncbi:MULTISPECIES: DegT/DnrJ/EryC1/StrS family aminotransferase [Frankia]|jgi:dTDP-4-amino-4,6-dideoxygalactose transaminase|uniref:L-alanine:N-amidino-3-keto-scyllo-inosamine aminotransferase n=1 Tax=Frankia alni (strain DSM 45986 / CECT 9034 / ACN14a) TaxID=326424 RepID=Q0RGV4_FRAAA|nr:MULTISPECIES: DegT/DnrJ/EryC1/StrS family aminotransferase [Frankia]CAJ63282.1 L-alanine:N-amidino-3-keto-scyllo-inosamine aminotransferase [Frankia alni ACN14a]
MSGPGQFFLGEEEAALVQRVLTSRRLSRYRSDVADPGDESMVFTLEREIEHRFGARHCIAVNSGTSAILASLAALGVGPGDEVIVPGYTFVATIAAVVHRGAVPVLAEIDESLTLDPEDVARRITPRTKAVIAVHMLGAPCAMDELRAITDAHGLALVEDVAQACGGSYRGRSLGTIGAAGAFSLNPFKVITGGDGGLLTCADDEVYERAFAFHDHGFRPLRQGVVDADSLFGMNLRMHELSGAVALAQLRKIDTILATLRRQKERLTDAIGEIPGVARRRLNDPAGDCCSLLVLRFESITVAEAVSSRIGSTTLINSGRHYYGNMPQLLGRRMPTKTECPFGCAAHPTAHRYRAHMLPRTDDILARSVALSVGVVDSYLGSGFGIDPFSSADDIASVADALHTAVNEVTEKPVADKRRT